jgi:anti-anti-sigma factor
MKFSVDKQDGLVVYELLEEKLTSLNAPVLKSELVLANAEGYKNIVVDLDKVKFVDSSGLSALLIGHRLCKEEKGIFGLCGLNDTVKNLIKISQLEDVLHVYSTQHDATSAIGSKKKKK